MSKLLKEPVAQKLILLLVIAAVIIVSLIAAKHLVHELIIGITGIVVCLAIAVQLFLIIADREKTQAVLKGQNIKIIRKSIELSDVMRQFEDKNYDLEISRKELNETLRTVKEREKDQRIIFENSPLGIIRLDPRGQIQYCNDKFAQLMGSSQNDLVGVLTAKTNTSKMQEAIDRAVNGEHAIFEGPFFPGNDTPSLDLRVVFNPVNPGVSPSEVIATIEDITQRVKAQQQLKQSHMELENLVGERTRELTREIEERKSAHEALAKSEEKYRSILESIEDSYFELDIKGNFTFFNNALMDLLGYSAIELTGLNYRVYTVPEDIDVLHKAFRQVYKTGQTTQLTYCHLRTKEGEIKSIGIIASLMRNKNGEPTGFQGLARDVTRQKMMESKLQQKQKMEAIGNLAGGVAHDFNNILSGIIGYTQLIKKHSSKESKIQPYVNQVIKASERATGLVKQILLFSRKTESEKIPSDIVLIAKEALKLLRASIPTTIDIQHDFNDDLDPVLADPTRIHQVFMNLCSNAAYAMKQDGGCLELILSETVVEEGGNDIGELACGRYVKISVCDTGKGMDRKTLEQIFDPYFTTKQVGEGTGLGLATVHGIIKAHDGVIRVESQPGKGTKFHIYLPAIAHKMEKAEQVVEVEKGTESILFVDDEVYLAEVGKEMLEDYGYSVVSKTSSKEAFAAFEQAPDSFDLVITDYTMPEMTGAQLASRIREINPDIPIVMCTGISLDPEVLGDAQFTKILMKPLDMDGLLVAVRSVLDK